jgi:hypothetical protein
MRTLQMACTAGVAVALLLALAAPAAAQETEPAPEAVSIEGTVVGEHWIDETAPACDAGTSWRFSSAGAGQLWGIGEVDYFLTHCTVFDAESSGFGSVHDDTTTTFTTADGDTLAVAHQFIRRMVFEDDAGAVTGFTLDGTWEAVGGTGRFTHAAGNGSMEGFVDIPPGEIVLNLIGEITYDATD